MTLYPHGYTEEDFQRLRSFYAEGEVVELMAAIGLFNYFNRFNDVLLMEPTQPASVWTPGRGLRRQAPVTAGVKWNCWVAHSSRLRVDEWGEHYG